MARSEDAYREALTGKSIPLLTLDNKWHQLFTQAQALLPADIRRLEERLNELIRRQGKCNTESKDIRRLKKKLMNEIMNLADETGGQPDARAEKALSEKRRLINDCNEKLEAYREELKELPAEIDRINYELMLYTMDVCYMRINENTKEIDDITQWIDNIRVEMKKKLVRKAEAEKANYDIYSYMHDIFGADVIELFDMKYNPEERKKEKQERRRQRELKGQEVQEKVSAGKKIIVDKETEKQ